MDFLVGMARSMPWADEAACAGSRRTWVVEAQHEKNAPGSILWRLETCQRCPVRRECLVFALEVPWGEAVGIWGATTTLERRAATGGRSAPGWNESTARKKIVAEAAAALEATLPERLEGWRARAVEQLRVRERRKAQSETATV